MSTETDGGWGHTRGWSKKVHFFEEGRAHCSGSPKRDGELLMKEKPREVTRGESICHECAVFAEALTRSEPDGRRSRARHNRGVPKPREPYFMKGRARLYANACA